MNTGNGRPSPLLRVRDLRVSFARRGGLHQRAVDGAGITVYPGQTVAIVGESGCGKSVTALSILRLVPTPPGRIEGGTVRLSTGQGTERDLLTLSETEMRAVRGNDIVMIFQEPMTSLNPVFTVGDQIAEAVLLHQDVTAKAARQTAARALEGVGIADAATRMDDYPHQFSGGMRQRVMIAMALACEPRLLLADEPTTALDVTVQAQILDLLNRTMRARGMGMVLITHDLRIVAQYTDVACVMYAGHVVEYAAVPELLSNPLHPYTRGLLACRARLGERRERLVTVREVLDRPGEFDRIPGVRPWWPGAPPPLTAVAGSPQSYTLREVQSAHWVGIWDTETGQGDRSGGPDLAFVREVSRTPADT